MNKMRKNYRAVSLATLATVGLAAATPAMAMDWMDNAVSVRYGTQFAEPYNNRKIDKTIAAFTHASGYAYGSNFLNVDLLLSDSKEPKNPGSSTGAAEAYVVYRHTLDLGKLSGQRMAYGPLRDIGLTAGFDLNHKEDTGYNSRKRMRGCVDLHFMGSTATERDAAQGAAVPPGWCQASRRNTAMRPLCDRPEGLRRGGRVCGVARLART
jgi:hypothetical protein